MKRKTTIRILIIGLVLLFTATAQADKIARYWKKHTEAKEAVIQAWKVGAPMSTLAEAIYNLGKYEVYLVDAKPAYAEDPRLVMYLADDPKVGINSSQDIHRLGYWILLYEVERQIGYMPSRRHLFAGKRFEIWEK